MNVESNGREFPTFASAEHVSSVLERTNLKHLLHFQRISPTQPFLQMKQEESLLPARLEALRHNTEKKESAQPNLSISLGPTLMTSQFHDVDDRSKTTPIFQLASRSRQLLPKPANSAPTTAPPMEPNGSLHVARPPPEGRGKTQLLPRYWPRITDQELQQLSGQYPHLSNSKIIPLFEKVLSASDAGRIGRLVLPKACAEAYFPPISQPEGLPLKIQDIKGKEWVFQFRFWPNNNSRMYVLEGVTPCIQSMQLQAGDTVTFSRTEPEGKLVMGYRKATNSTAAQMFKGSSEPNLNMFSNNLSSGCGDINWSKLDKSDDMSKDGLMLQPSLISARKRVRNIGTKSKRLLIDSVDVLELRLTWEEAQELLRPPQSAKPSICTVEDHDFEEYDVRTTSFREEDRVCVTSNRVRLHVLCVTTMRGVLRRFNDFLKLLTDLKKAFPRKSFPSAPPKGLLRMKSRAVLEERRCSLEEWITKLLSDIELARSVVIASFLELEAAARSACQDVDQNASDANNDSTSSSPMVHPSLSLFQTGGSSSLTSDYGSDTVYETSELGSPSVGQDDISEIGTEDLTMDEEVTNPIEKLVNFSMSNIDEGLSMSQTILEQLEDFSKRKVRSRYVDNIQGKDVYNGNASKDVFLGNNGSRLLSELESSAHSVMHNRNLSVESADGFSLHTGETSTSGLLSSSSESHLELHRGAGVSHGTGLVCNPERQGSTQIVLPVDLRKKLNKILLATNERLVNAKTDMEDLIARLNQEIAVKDYLNKKVNDLEGELETTKQRSKENLEQAILTERERCTQMRWDMEELRQKSYEMEMKLKSREDGSSHEEPTEEPTISERAVLSKELDARKQQLGDLSRRYNELEAKSKADIKVLVKEVKSLRRSHVDLEKKLTQSLTDKTEAEKLLEHERKLLENSASARKKLLSDCRILHDRLKEYNLNLSTDVNGSLVEDSTTVSDALRLLSISDDQIEEVD
ncbi:hypothetical protein F2Q68_00037723 [Brassica cretica]|uniref:PX domain-containing protein n=1 Tax=Brassica cretica TaxID=69181 RepID=A0A8S9GXW0_BRACR|nr:hypothetical protein F2Q68_00037723 [Brassica cretica]